MFVEGSREVRVLPTVRVGVHRWKLQSVRPVLCAAPLRKLWQNTLEASKNCASAASIMDQCTQLAESDLPSLVSTVTTPESLLKAAAQPELVDRVRDARVCHENVACLVQTKPEGAAACDAAASLSSLVSHLATAVKEHTSPALRRLADAVDKEKNGDAEAPVAATILRRSPFQGLCRMADAFRRVW